MRLAVLVNFIGIISANLFHAVTFSQVKSDSCRFAFNFVNKEFDVVNQLYICVNSSEIPFQYESEINMPVCDDTLCANVVLKIYWDLAGNYKSFDTIAGKPLTKFDHKKFSSDDYQKLDKILKSRNSILRVIKKEELVDKSVKIKSTVVDAVTGATPKTISESVVEGAVYSSFTLWHFVNGEIKAKMAVFTNEIYSEQVARELLFSDNYETQLFALKRWAASDFEVHSPLLFQVIRQSVPLVRAYAIGKAPLPFPQIENNREFVALFPSLDDYSKSIFLNRITTEESAAKSLLPLVLQIFDELSKKQQELIVNSCQRFDIPENQKQKE
jgi:hypothetical protein